MATTRMKVSTSARVFHRVAADNDMPEHDIGTTDTVATGMGGNADFQLEADSTVVHVDVSKVQGTAEAAIGGDVAITSYIYIKNTGFEEAAKTTATTSDLTVGIGGLFSAGGFTLSAGEAIALHGLGGGSNNLSEIQLDSSSGDIYAEIIYL